jgi:hypothetical protein
MRVFSLVVVVVTAIASGCGQAQRAPLRDPTEAVHVLQRQGYTFQTLPGAPPGAGSGKIESRFDTRYGQPVAYLHKDGLYVSPRARLPPSFACTRDPTRLTTSTPTRIAVAPRARPPLGPSCE